MERVDVVILEERHQVALHDDLLAVQRPQALVHAVQTGLVLVRPQVTPVDRQGVADGKRLTPGGRVLGNRVVGVARGMRDAPAANQCTKEEREDEGQQDRADEDQAVVARRPITSCDSSICARVSAQTIVMNAFANSAPSIAGAASMSSWPSSRQS